MKIKAVSRHATKLPGDTGSQAAGVASGSVSVVVVFAEPQRLWQTRLSIAPGSSVAQALALSGFAKAFPDYPHEAPALGIFGRRCRLDQTVSEGDRIEIYRPLSFDPMESRRRRAAHRKASAGQAQFRPRRVRDAP